ncbi:YlzJ-like family protein [Caldinitratiruptor microaerophilus]|uniref:Uncharacterized protein n=1 Tax=Caldinitratiruptor microaerophilus TaxID=671077 RepID=A0AA35G6W1_9FIRM|nr:YlzJ-like family protein [Caldinitratiruptor microaerophilus]BDG59436.1 hypothetical protein caldi_05260 [Caldinitratiruptor microaerophilus]
MCILHTVMPLDVVLAGLDLPSGTGPVPAGLPAAGTGRTQVVALGGARFVEVEAGRHGFVVRRLISPLPRDYLDPALQPGSPFPCGASLAPA